MTVNHMSLEQLAALGITESTLADMLRGGGEYKGWCVDMDGRVAAFVMVECATGSIYALFTHPDYQQRGLGSALLDTAVGYLRASGHATITLPTAPGTPAYCFYLSRGWQPVGEADRGDVLLQLDPGNC